MKDDHPAFLTERTDRVARYPEDGALMATADTFIKESLRAEYSYNFDWLGLPIIQYPQDLLALQEIIWSTRPDLIVETGVARGGSLVFYASMLELLGGDGRVIGIDVDLREHNRQRIVAHPMARRVDLVDGSSISPETVSTVFKLAEGRQRILVVLDSNHTHDHVLAELEAYTPLVGPGGYCVAFDTIIEMMPQGHYKDRPWDKGNNAATAVDAFLRDHPGWTQDMAISNKLLVSAAPGGYLKRIC
jgi:Cephalosporin hydroxylase